MSTYKHTHSHLKDKLIEIIIKWDSQKMGMSGGRKSFQYILFDYHFQFESCKYFAYSKIKHEYIYLHKNIHL